MRYNPHFFSVLSKLQVCDSSGETLGLEALLRVRMVAGAERTLLLAFGSPVWDLHLSDLESPVTESIRHAPDSSTWQINNSMWYFSFFYL